MQIDAHRQRERQLLRERHAAEREREDGRAEREAAAEDAPVERTALARARAAQEHAGDRDQRDDEADQKHGLARHEAGEPAGGAGDREDAGREREPAKHLDHAQFGPDVGLGARLSRFVDARDHFRGHRVGDHVLDHDPDHHRHRAEDVELVRPGMNVSQPPAAPASVTSPNATQAAPIST